jgi:hypothetical protein
MARKAGVIVIGIISIIALGLSAYMFISSQLLKQPEQKVVGVWDKLERNTDYAPYNTLTNWLVEISEDKYIDQDYFTLSNTDTRLTLIEAGLYRVQMTFLLEGITNLEQYWVELLKNGTHVFYLDYHSGTSSSLFHEVHAEGYVLSDGNDYIEIRAYTSSINEFYIYNPIPSLNFNQFSLEYIPS